VFEAERPIAEMPVTIKHMQDDLMADADQDTPNPLPNVSGMALQRAHPIHLCGTPDAIRQTFRITHGLTPTKAENMRNKNEQRTD